MYYRQSKSVRTPEALAPKYKKLQFLAGLLPQLEEPMLGGGTIFALDHLIPNGVPIENFRYYVNKSRELLGKPPVSGEGWERMAF